MLKERPSLATVGTLPLTLVLAFASWTVAAQDPATKPFHINQDTPTTGSNIKRDIVRGTLPYDKTYAELTPEQKRTFRARYQQLGEDDEPPFPVDGLGPLMEAISKANQKARGGFGKLEMDVLIDAAGNPTKIEVFQSHDYRVTEYASTIAMLTKFKPAICQGNPCAMGFPVRINFVRR